MHMNRAVFDLKVSVHAVSLYILICALLDDGREPTVEAVRSQWAASQEALQAAAAELAARGVVRMESESGVPSRFLVQPSAQWVWVG
ncbi:MAG: hypothetical protein WHS86_07115 [Desulfosoma sp.]